MPLDENEKVELRALRHDLNDHSRILTEFTQDQRKQNDMLEEIKRNEAVRANNEGHAKDRFDEIERRIDKVYNLGVWVLGALGLALINGVAGPLIQRLFQQ